MICDSDQTIPFSLETDASELVPPSSELANIPNKISPKRGRPKKQPIPEDFEPPPKPQPKRPQASKPFQPPPTEDEKSKLLKQLYEWKDSPVFGARLAHIKFNDGMSLESLQDVFRQMKSIIGRDFNRMIVEGFFQQSLNLSETFMVSYMEWQHAEGIAAEIFSEKEDFKDELEELTLMMSNRLSVGPGTRLVAKTILKGMKIMDEKTNGLKKKKVNVEF